MLKDVVLTRPLTGRYLRKAMNTISVVLRQTCWIEIIVKGIGPFLSKAIITVFEMSIWIVLMLAT